MGDEQGPGPDARVSLREITKETVDAVIDMKVRDDQVKFVAPNAVSLAQALVHQDVAWYRAICADEVPVGFVMLVRQPAAEPQYVWRFMIDERFQGLGHGRRAMELLIEHARSLGSPGLRLTFVDQDGSPEPFYAGLGFQRTGRVIDGETEMRLILSGE